MQASEALHFCIKGPGEGAWDNADSTPGKNYVATRAGTYRLVNGQLMLLPPNLPVLLVRALSVAAHARRAPPQRATRCQRSFHRRPACIPRRLTRALGV